jgi:HEAT repeat protein
MEAILALGKIQDERALIALQQTLSNPDPVIQRATLQALAWLDKPEAYDLLRSFEASSTDPRMKLLAQMLLKVPKRTIPIYMD